MIKFACPHPLVCSHTQSNDNSWPLNQPDHSLVCLEVWFGRILWAQTASSVVWRSEGKLARERERAKVRRVIPLVMLCKLSLSLRMPRLSMIGKAGRRGSCEESFNEERSRKGKGTQTINRDRPEKERERERDLLRGAFVANKINSHPQKQSLNFRFIRGDISNWLNKQTLRMNLSEERIRLRILDEQEERPKKKRSKI